MKHYLIEIATGDKKVAGKGVYECATEREAMAAYHKKLGTAMGSDLYASDLVQVLTEQGVQVACTFYVAPTAAEAVDDAGEE